MSESARVKAMWTAGVWAALALSAGVGLSMGLIGGGGSIVTVPVLVYVAGIPLREAIALSLLIVGTTALVGALLQARAGNIHWKASGLYGGMGMLGAAFGAQLTPLVPPPILMTLFAALITFVGLRMLRGQPEMQVPEKAECSVWKCGITGLAIGVATGFLGVGGGFLIVPALLRFAKLTMRHAIGTSLLILAANSAAGFAAHVSEARGTLALGFAFTAAAVAGMMMGLTLGRRARPEGLQAAFGVLSLTVAALLLTTNINPLLRLLAESR